MAKRSRDVWTAEEEAVLQRMRKAGMEWRDVAVALGRTVEAVRYRWRCSVPRAERVPAPGGTPWSADEDAALRRMCAEGVTWVEMARRMDGRTSRGCQMRARLLGIRRAAGQKEEAPAGMLSRRRCHDCGKPTTDYRCPSCLAAWRRRNGVPAAGGEEEEGYEAFGSRWPIA